jgi:sterol 3beta-glucosyltransferase
MCIVVGGDEEVFFDFKDTGLRDDCTVSIHLSLNAIEPAAQGAESGLLSREEIEATQLAKQEHQALIQARRLEKPGEDSDETDVLGMKHLTPDKHAANNGIADSMMFDATATAQHTKPDKPLRITCLTIGSRGDVQPYIALCKGLLKEGHIPRIATHAEFGPWILKHGIAFEPIEGDPAVLMQLCVENGMFTFSFMKEASSHFRSWIEGLMDSAWKACQNSDVIIESPSAMVGIHISEALQVPYFRAFGMPWTRTRAFPHAFFVPNNKSGGTYNYMTYTLFDNLFWKSTSGQMNNWRRRQLGLKPTSLSRMGVNKVPFLYNFSKAVVRQPLDWSEWVRITGYWFLDEEEGWKPPDELTQFIARARKDGKKLVYIGFGSITVEDPAALTQTVIRAVVDTDVRCVLSKGWSDRMVKESKAETAEVELPPEILQIKYSVPHSWLFPQMDAITHHGGAGTTGASLRAGKPTIIKPFFGDQYFFGSRVEDLGVGIYVRSMNEKKFGRALYYATHDERMRKKAELVGAQIRAEDGVSTAIDAIYRDLDYARSLVHRKALKTDAFGRDGPMDAEQEMEEEQWTFVGDDSDPDLKQMQESMHWDHEKGGLVIGPEEEAESPPVLEKGKWKK